MKNYRLKKEAVPFFKEKLATEIHSIDVWESYHVDPKALEEVKPMFISYGIPFGNGSDNSKSLGGWSQKDGNKFHFTLNFPSVKYCDHDKFSNGKIIRKLMDNIQSQVDNFYQEFVNELNNTES